MAKKKSDKKSDKKKPDGKKGTAKSKSAPKKVSKGKSEKLSAATPLPFKEPISSVLRTTPGTLLDDIDSSSTPGLRKKDRKNGKEIAAALLSDIEARIGELQERLYAGGRDGEGPAILLVLQGMDTSGKGGIVRHVVGAVDPQGIRLTSFKKPTKEELSHPFLWRIRNALPAPGMIGVFDRSQYEDVLIVRVHDLVPRATWARRYSQINTFERGVVNGGTRVIKVMLHISKDEQHARLAERLERPDKYWKFNPGDLDERAYWDDYREAYQAVIDKTSTEDAPWFVVPADRKWYARLAVAQLLLEHLEALNLQWPEATFDVAEQQARLESEGSADDGADDDSDDLDDDIEDDSDK